MFPYKSYLLLFLLTVDIVLYRAIDLFLFKEKEIVGTIMSLRRVDISRKKIHTLMLTLLDPVRNLKESAQTGFPQLSSLAPLKVWLSKSSFCDLCSVVKPDFYFSSLYFRSLQIKLAMLFLICTHVRRKLETNMFSDSIKTSKTSRLFKESKNLNKNCKACDVSCQQFYVRTKWIDMYTNLRAIQ